MQRLADMQIYTTLGNFQEHEFDDPLGAYELGYLWCFKRALNFRGDDGSKMLVNAEAADAARVLFKLKRWDECCRVLELCVTRSLDLEHVADEKILSLFGEVLCPHLRD